jgi:cell division protein ZapA
MSDDSIKVEIYNQTYTIRSDGDNEYIHQLAAYVDTKMREVTSGTYTVDTHKVAILAALHIADELHQLRIQHEQSDSELARRSAECTDTLDQLFKNRAGAASEPVAPF